VRLAISAIGVVLLCASHAGVAETRSPEAQAALAQPLHRLETADYRATGHLVRVDAKGTRSSYPITLKVHWFPGVLRVFGDVEAPGQLRVRMLLEMRPGGQVSIQIAHPGDKSPVTLPFAQWSDGPLGPAFGSGFSYEDFLEPQFFWPGQSVAANTKFGARICDLLTSTPGAQDRTHYVRVKSWLDHAIGYPVYVEKTLKGTGITKEFTYFGLRQNGGVWSASQVEARIQGQDGAQTRSGPGASSGTNRGSTLLMIEHGTTKANLDLKDFGPEQLTRF
jgi:hypothetical protein